MSVYPGVIEGIHHGRLRFATGRCDLTRNRFQAGLRPAGQKDPRTFRRKLLGTAAPMEPPAPNTTAHLFSSRQLFPVARPSPWFSMVYFIVFPPFCLAPSTSQCLRVKAADIFFQ